MRGGDEVTLQGGRAGPRGAISTQSSPRDFFRDRRTQRAGRFLPSPGVPAVEEGPQLAQVELGAGGFELVFVGVCEAGVALAGIR